MPGCGICRICFETEAGGELFGRSSPHSNQKGRENGKQRGCQISARLHRQHERKGIGAREDLPPDGASGCAVVSGGGTRHVHPLGDFQCGGMFGSLMGNDQISGGKRRAVCLPGDCMSLRIITGRLRRNSRRTGTIRTNGSAPRPRQESSTAS